MKTERFRILEEDAAVLKQIADKYPPSSKEHQAVRRAAFALSFALTKSPEQFSNFVQECQADLTQEQRSYLEKLGLQ